MYTDQYLFDNGAASGSTIVMTPNAFMTDKAWLQSTPHIIAGIRAMDFLKDNPRRSSAAPGHRPATSWS